MDRIKGNSGLALGILLAASLLGCEKTPEQDRKMESMKDDMSESAGQMKESASEAADSMKESAGEMKHSADSYIDDAAITANIKSKLMAEPATKAHQISVETLNGTVQLSGFVQSSEEKNMAEEIARAVPGVKSVRNDLILKSKTQGMDDSRKIGRA